MERCSDRAFHDVRGSGAPAVTTAVAPLVFVLALLLAAAPFFCPAAQAAVRVAGVNGWLSDAAGRSMGAVYEHIPEESSPETKEKLLRMVAERLLTGYDVIGVAFGEDGDLPKIGRASCRERV